MPDQTPEIDPKTELPSPHDMLLHSEPTAGQPMPRLMSKRLMIVAGGIIASLFFLTVYTIYAIKERAPIQQLPSPTPTMTPEKEIRAPTASEGEFCGGIAGIPCAADYRCELDGNYPDAGGLCIKLTPKSITPTATDSSTIH